jgi:NADP-dependent 3-hydroxy acid dehydrogenase YdfG
MTLENKVAIVTGASRGIGESIALTLASQGVDVALFARDVDGLERVAHKVRETGRQCLTVTGSVGEPNDVQRCIQATLETFGKIDILINNAGVGVFKSVKDTDLEEWKKIIDVNLTGVFLCSKAVLEPMIERGQGTIINISSDIGKRTIPKASAYCASKYGVQAFTEVLSKEVRKFGIRVGTICPGMTDTYFAGSEQGVPEKVDWLKGEDVAEAVVYMCSAPKHAILDEITIHPIIQEY